MLVEKYKKLIAEFLKSDSNNIFLYWKGRVALYAFLKSLNLKLNDEVILPAFTCVVVPNAIIYAGLKPVYVDISKQTYNMDFSLIEKAITSRTKVIICQNTFGLSSDIDKIVAIAKKNNLYTIEDCTHGFGGYYKGKPNGAFCDAAFFSTQWNKPFSTGIGGILLVNKKDLLTNVKLIDQNIIEPKFIEKFILQILLIVRPFLINRFTYYISVRIYRFLSEHNLTVGSNQSDELNSISIPENYFKDISKVQVRSGINALRKLETINLRRKKNAKDYSEFLKKHTKTFVNESLFDDHIFLKYPLLVRDRSNFLKIASKGSIVIGDWFLSPIHPIPNEELSRWAFDISLFPVAESISKKIVNLPTDIADNQKVLKFLEQNIDWIE